MKRRQFIFSVAALAALPVSAQQDPKRTRLVLLGTKGGPRVGTTPKNPSTLLLINGVPYVVDFGYGTSVQLVAAGVPLNTVRYMFLTHHHSDHMLEYGTLLYNAWAAGLRSPIDVYGPPGVDAMRRSHFEYMKLDIETRIADEGRPDLRKLVTAHEFEKGGVVMQNADVKVSAALVRHPPVVPSFAYRFDAKDRSIVISGDTTYAPELAEFAKGADVLVHEVMYLPGLEALLKKVPNAATLREHLLASHTVPEDVGRIAAAANVKTLVLSHLVPGDDPSISDAQWTEGVRKHYGGRIVVGKDLLEI
ncbi:MAG TPA: MBL fold metallo-hydrolase [Burkholderiales bacterium]